MKKLQTSTVNKKYKAFWVIIICIQILGFQVSRVEAQGIKISNATMKAAGDVNIVVRDGNLINNGTYEGADETFWFTGTAPATIGGTTTTSFANLTLDNNAGLLLENDVFMDGMLYFQNGIVTTGNWVLDMSPVGSIFNPGPDRYVNGKLAFTFDAVGTRFYPIGKGGNYRPLTFQYTNLTGTSIVCAEQFENPLSGSLPEDVILLTTNRYWSINQTGGTNTAYFVTLDATDYTPSQSVYMLKEDEGTVISYETTAPDYTNAMAFNEFSNFGLGEACANPTEAGIIEGNQVSCDTYDPETITSIVPAGIYAGSLEYKWQQSETGSTTGFEDIGNSNSENYDPGYIERTTWYRRLARVDCKTDWSGAVSSNVVEKAVIFQTVQLTNGWSAISTFLILNDPSIVHIMQPVASNLNILLGTQGLYAPPPFNINTLNNWDIFKGYKIKMKNADELTFCGTLLPDNTLMAGAGFQIIPVLTNVVSPIATVFENPASDILYLLDLVSNNLYWPEGGIYTLSELVPGKGYLAQFKVPVTIDFPDYDPLLFGMKNSSSDYISGPWPCKPNFNVHLISVDRNATSNFNADYLGAFDNDGNCIGFTNLTPSNGNYSLVVFGDDEYSTAKDGAAVGEKIHFKGYNSAKGVEEVLSAVFDPSMPQNDGNYSVNGLSKIINFYKSTTGHSDNEIAELVQLYPNPASDEITIIYPFTGNTVQMTLVAAEGKILITQSINKRETQLNVRNLNPGVYVLCLKSDSNLVFKRLVIR